MPQQMTVESRLERLEEEVARLGRQVAGRNGGGAAGGGWLDRVTGSMRDAPEFDQVLALGRAIRQGDAPPPDPCADDATRH